MQTHTAIREERVLFKGETSSFSASRESREQHRQSQISSEPSFSTPKPQMSFQEIFGKNSEQVQKLTNMSDDEYHELLSGTTDIDAMFPKTQAGTEFRLALEAMISELEIAIDSMNTTDMRNVNFQEFFAKIGRAIDRHLMPLLKKYKGREDELLHGVLAEGMREKIQDDRRIQKANPERKVSNPFPQLFESLNLKDRVSYDRVLQHELRSGRNLRDMKREYSDLVRSSEGENLKDARGMLKAIDDLESERKKIATRFMLPRVLRDLPAGVHFTVDPTDAEVVMNITKEQMKEFASNDENVRQRSDGSVELMLDGKKHTIVYDSREKAYEVVL